MSWNNPDLSPLAPMPPAPPVEARALPRRLSRVRFSWFIMGALIGSVATSVISNMLVYPSLLQAYVSEQGQKVVSLASQFTLAPLPKSKKPAPVPVQPEVALTQEAAEPEKPALTLPASFVVEIKRGHTLGAILGDYGISAEEVAILTDSLRKVYNPRNLNAGQTIELSLDKSDKDPEKPAVTTLTVKPSALRTITVKREGDGFTTKAVDAPTFSTVARGGGVITSSLYETGVQAGIPASMLADIIKAFSYDVDFQRDIKDGDKLDVVYERKETETGITAGHGDVLYAALTLRGKEKAIYRFESKDGTTAWYNKVGESVRKALLRTPINGARLTSGFGMRRHPIMGYSKMHRGVDFGAATGTPIYAAGDGTVAEAGRKGGYGNYVRIRHSGKYSTAYGHASRIAKGIRVGTKVKQGQVIAYVGSTGQSTGPHLHYEVLVNNSQVNPSGVKFKYGNALAGKDLKQFKGQVQQVQVALNKIPMNKAVALAALK